MLALCLSFLYTGPTQSPCATESQNKKGRASEDISMKNLNSTKLNPVLFGMVLLAAAVSAVAAPCTGPGAPTNTQTRCLTAIPITGSQLKSFDISFVNPDRAEYYLGDRSTRGVDIIDIRHLKF